MTRAIAHVLAIGTVVSLAAPASAQDTAKAERLFRTARCVFCHSIGEKEKRPGALDDVGSRLKAEEIRAWLTNPEQMRAKTKATRMPPMPNPKLTKEEIDTLVAYLRTLKTPPKQR